LEHDVLHQRRGHDRGRVRVAGDALALLAITEVRVQASGTFGVARDGSWQSPDGARFPSIAIPRGPSAQRRQQLKRIGFAAWMRECMPALITVDLILRGRRRGHGSLRLELAPLVDGTPAHHTVRCVVTESGG
jgi:hypothetical protein